MIFRRIIPVSTAGLLYTRGRLHRVLPAGRHRLPWGGQLVLVDLRERLIQVARQEVPTAEGLTVRVTAVARVAVVDPQLFHERADDPDGTVYLATQVALREALGALSIEELAQRGARLPVAELTAAVAEVARAVGLEVRQVIVKDVVLPQELRSAAIELATARQRGQAQLEAARAETAALRSLANAAKVLDAHPALAQLRMVQEARPGTTLVIHGQGATSEVVEA